MKLEVGMYVRTNGGNIRKIENFKSSIYNDFIETPYKELINKKDIKKASHNIIDLIEVGDYVNGSEVLDFENEYIKEDDKFVPFGVITENCFLENTDSWIIEKNIKSVITHEQMEQMEYRLGVLNDYVEILDEEEFEDIEEITLNGEKLGYGVLSEWLGSKQTDNDVKLCSSIECLGITLNLLIKNQKKIIERLNKEN